MCQCERYQYSSWDYHTVREQRVRDNSKATAVKLILPLMHGWLSRRSSALGLRDEMGREVAVICTIKSTCFSSELRLKMFLADIQRAKASFFFFFNLYGGWAATRRYTAGLGDRSYKCHVSGTKRGSIRLFIAANVSGWGQKRQVLDADINVIVRFAKLYVHIFYIMDGLHFHVHGSLENGQFCHLKDASCRMLLDFLLKQTSPTLAHFTFITNANRQVEAEEEREMWQMDDLSSTETAK